MRYGVRKPALRRIRRCDRERRDHEAGVEREDTQRSFSLNVFVEIIKLLVCYPDRVQSTILPRYRIVHSREAIGSQV